MGLAQASASGNCGPAGEVEARPGNTDSAQVAGRPGGAEGRGSGLAVKLRPTKGRAEELGLDRGSSSWSDGAEGFGPTVAQRWRKARPRLADSTAWARFDGLWIRPRLYGSAQNLLVRPGTVESQPKLL